MEMEVVVVQVGKRVFLTGPKGWYRVRPNAPIHTEAKMIYAKIVAKKKAMRLEWHERIERMIREAEAAQND
jgi:hypothetical protein